MQWKGNRMNRHIVLQYTYIYLRPKYWFIVIQWASNRKAIDFSTTNSPSYDNMTGNDAAFRRALSFLRMYISLLRIMIMKIMIMTVIPTVIMKITIMKTMMPHLYIILLLHIVNLQRRASVGQLQIMRHTSFHASCGHWKHYQNFALGTSPWHSPIIPERRCCATCISALQLVNMAKPP